MPIPRNKDLFDLTATQAAAILPGDDYPWMCLSLIKNFIDRLGETLSPERYEKAGEHIWIAKDAVVAPSAFIGDHTIIGERTEVRHCAFIRGSALVGADCVVGNSCELKNVILFDHVQVPHYNYVGDSVLGTYAHMGAGAVTSNVKSDNSDVVIKSGDESIATGRRKVGAFVGDHAEVGCNSVLCPGAVVGRGTTVYPLSRVRGCVPADSVYKDRDDIVHKY
ncbi:MAG: UDP-N-acetylglucosamine pyrophosphorylase [Clostridia bacterium]|nr:UDP-N-acetylglucosamine pyrophosphorylase [Clostridia bacterium]